ncbi:hypothetical protein MD484_g4221, partial [Candolleomyces efflorescens]
MMTPATSPATEEPAQPITPNRHKPSSSVSATFGFFPSSSSQGEDSASASGSGSATRSGNRSLGGASPSLKGSKVSPFKGTKQASKKQISKNLKKLAPGTSVKLTKGVKATTASRSSIPSVGRSYAKITHPKGKAASGPPKTNRNGGRKSGSAKQTPAKSPAKVRGHIETLNRGINWLNKVNMKAPKVQAPKVVKAGKKGVRQGVQNSKANVARKPNRPARPQPPSRKPVAKPSAAGDVMKLLDRLKRAILSKLPVSLMDLPTELILQILEELDDDALCALGATCKGLNNLVFPFFFQKHKIRNPSQGWITCSPDLPLHTLRAIRSCLSTKNICSIHYYFSKGLEELVEELEEMHAIVRRADCVTDFRVYLMEVDEWAVRDAVRLDEAQLLPLTSEEWTRLFLALLTTALTKGCRDVLLEGGTCFLKYLQHREQNAAETVSAKSLAVNRLLTAQVDPRQATQIQRVSLQSEMFFATPSFLDWTHQFFSCETWRLFFSGIHLTSLIEFEALRIPAVGDNDALIRGRDILAFLSRHPNIEKLSLCEIEIPSCALPDHGEPILPNLVQVIAHPVYIRWLLRNGGKQRPKLKQVSLQTEHDIRERRLFQYDAMDNALEDLLPHSHNLDLTFRFTNDHSELDSWLQSHIDAGPDRSIGSQFIDTKRLEINCAHSVKFFTPSRRQLFAQFLGLFPNLEALELAELAEQEEVPLEDSRMMLLVKTLQLHCPQIKTVKYHNMPSVNIR